MSRDRNSYKPVSFSEGNTYNERTNKFIGVDLTSPQMEVALNRGVYSNNYVRKGNGKVETRFSYGNIHRFPIGSSAKIMGFAEFIDDNGAYQFIAATNTDICHAVLNSDGYIELDEVIYSGANPTSFSAFQSGNKLWILTGTNYLIVYYSAASAKTCKLVCEPVSSWSGVHVPTVTYMGIPTNADSIPSVTNVTLEYPNLLTAYRKDMYLTGLGTKAAGNSSYVYPPLIKANIYDYEHTTITVDLTATETLVFENPVKIPDSAFYTKTEVVMVDYSNVETTVSGQNSHFDWIFFSDSAVRTAFLGHCGTGYANLYLAKLKVFHDSDGNVTSAHLRYQYWAEGVSHTEENLSTTDLNGGFCVRIGKAVALSGGLYSLQNTSLTFYADFKPVIGGKPNVTITYPYLDSTDLAKNVSLIGKCTFGTMFGKNNSLNRLWLSGNPDMPNYAIHSSEPYKNIDTEPTRAETDLSYFSDESLIKFGEDMNAVIGMVPLSPDKMMVLKNRAGRERTMFFVSPFDVQEVIAKAGSYGTMTLSSDLSITREEYSTSMSNTSTAGFTKVTVDVVNGETLFMSPEGRLVGLDIEGITGDNQRVANTRSYFIDKELMAQDLTHANLFHNGDYVFLSTDSKLYVAAIESLHLAITESGSEQTSKQFEWWPCDPIPSTVNAVTMLHDGKLMICTDDGIYSLTDNPKDRRDSKNFFLSYGNTNSEVEQGHIATSQTIYDLLSEYDGETDAEFHCKQTWSTTNVYGNLSDISGLVVTSVPSQAYTAITHITQGQPAYGFYIPPTNEQGRKLIAQIEMGNLFLVKTQAQGYLAGFFVRKSELSWASSYFQNYDPEDVYMLKVMKTNDGTPSFIGQYGNTNLTLYRLIPEVTYACKNNDPDTYGSASFALFEMDDDKNRTYLTIVDPTGNSTIYPTGVLSIKNRIEPFFATLRLTQGKLGYDKTIDNLTIWNDSNNPCELYVGLLRNKQGEVKYGLGLIDQGIGFDMNDIDFTRTDFDKNAVPKFSNFKRLPRSQQSFTICFTAKSKRNSVLGGVDILYRVKKARNKR